MAKLYKLSKSQYCKGKKCLKAVWLYNHKRDLADEPTPFQQNIFDQGTDVGKFATSYFENGVEIKEGYNEVENAIESTKKAVANNASAVFEAAFLYDEILIRVDVLRNNGDGSWDLIEVKSTNSVEPKSHHDDLAIQKWVLKKSGIKIRKSILMHLNKEYTRRGDLELKKLFTLEELDSEIEPHYEKVPKLVSVIKETLKSSIEPTELIGSKCKNPYVCEFKTYCWEDAVPGSIHTIGRISDKKRHALMDMGVSDVSDIPDSFDFSGNQLVEVLSHKHDDVKIELPPIQKHIKNLKYPLYFLDYESVAYAVPKYDGSWPHKHLVSQYSLHIQESPDSELVHKEYLHNEYTDPSREVSLRLLEDIKNDGGSVIVYHKVYERDRTKQLADQFPDLAPRLHDLIDRMWDLETPFSKRWYWDKRFNGSASIKSVLPVFAPEFSYKDLEIQKGDIAQLEYSRMIEMPKDSDERKNIRVALLAYCKRDTLAMVVILEALRKTLDGNEEAA